MCRIAKSTPHSGIFPHREHRSRKGRKIYIFKDKLNAIERKQKIEKARVLDLETDLKL